MFYVDYMPIYENEIDVLNNLKIQLQTKNIHIIDKIKKGYDYLMITCPFHGNGHERKPSCGISTKATKDKPSGLVHCFTCGYSANLETFISNCFGYNDCGLFGREWLLKNYISVSINERQELNLDLNRKKDEKPMEYVSEKELEKYRYYHPYMYERNLTNFVLDGFDVGYDMDKEEITFPVRDKDGNTLFIVRRSINGKYYEMPENVVKPIYGIYELPEGTKEVIVCESCINALTCYVYGKPAIALLGTGSQHQYELLKRMDCRKFILAFDGDDAGRRATKRFKENVTNKIITSYVLPEGKDINDLYKDEFDKLEEIY